jgi:membrane-associated phospholipid phosphatase
MGDQRVASAEEEGAEGISHVSDRVARWVTEIFAPQVLVIGMPPVVGLVSDGWTGFRWGFVASALCGGVPAVVIAMGVRSGRLDSRHIVDRSRRTAPLLVAVVAVFAALLLLGLLGAPRLLIATVGAMLAGLAVTVPVTLKWKISFHAAVSAGTVLVLARVLPVAPTLAGGAVVVALVGWARVRLAHHTAAQVAAGALVGGASAWAILVLYGV